MRESGDVPPPRPRPHRARHLPLPPPPVFLYVCSAVPAPSWRLTPDACRLHTAGDLGQGADTEQMQVASSRRIVHVAHRAGCRLLVDLLCWRNSSGSAAVATSQSACSTTQCHLSLRPAISVRGQYKGRVVASIVRALVCCLSPRRHRLNTKYVFILYPNLGIAGAGAIRFSSHSHIHEMYSPTRTRTRTRASQITNASSI
eukprot:scaffold25776_cov106-Isochrysis_galbana.AAC.2